MTQAPTPLIAYEMTKSLNTAVATSTSPNDTVWQQTIASGYQMIDAMYRPHPILRPIDVIRRWQARRWWKQEVERAGQQLGATMLEARLRTFTTAVNRPQDEEDFTYREQHRRTQRTFDTDEQIRLAQGMAKAQADAQIAIEREKAMLNPAPSPTTQLEHLLRWIADVEQDPSLTQEQKQRRLALLQGQRDLLSGGR